VRGREALALRLGRLGVLAQELLGPALPAPLGIGVVAVVDVHRQRHSALPRQFDRLGIDQRGVLDRVGAGKD